MNKNAFRIGLFALAALVALSFVTGFWYTVDAGEQAVVLRLGAVSQVTGPGFHLKMPFVETVQKIDTRVKTLEWSHESPMESYSRDQQPAKVSVKVSFRVLPDEKSITELYTRYRDLAGYTDSVILPRTYEGVKTTFGQFDAVTAIQERARLNTEVENAVRKLIAGPIAVEGVQIQDIAFSESYEQSIEQRMQAQVEVEKVMQNKSREQLQADIRVIQANAQAQSVKLQGEAEAAAIDARGKALRDNPQLVALVAAEKWNGILPTTMVPGGTTPFVSIPMGK